MTGGPSTLACLLLSHQPPLSGAFLGCRFCLVAARECLCQIGLHDCTQQSRIFVDGIIAEEHHLLGLIKRPHVQELQTSSSWKLGTINCFIVTGCLHWKQLHHEHLIIVQIKHFFAYNRKLENAHEPCSSSRLLPGARFTSIACTCQNFWAKLEMIVTLMNVDKQVHKMHCASCEL